MNFLTAFKIITLINFFVVVPFIANNVLAATFLGHAMTTMYRNSTTTSAIHSPKDILATATSRTKGCGRHVATNRSRRFVMFDGGGVIKMVLGFSTPLNFMDNDPYRQLTVIYNFHLQYTPPPEPLYWWSILGAFDINGRHMTKRANVDENFDKSRVYFYKLIEDFLSGQGLDGKRCLLKAICLNADLPVYGELPFHDWIRLILSPPDANDLALKDYVHAKHAGIFGVDCNSIYDNCQLVADLFEKYSYYV